MDPGGLEDRAHRVGDVLDVGVGEIEGPDDEVFVGLPVRGGVGGDQDRLLVHDLVEVVLLAHERLQRPLELDVVQDDRDVLVLELRVEDDVDARGGGQRLVDLLERLGLREVQADRLVARGLEHGRPRARARGCGASSPRGPSPRPFGGRPWPPPPGPCAARSPRTGWSGRARTACSSSTTASSGRAELRYSLPFSKWNWEARILARCSETL